MLIFTVGCTSYLRKLHNQVIWEIFEFLYLIIRQNFLESLESKNKFKKIRIDVGLIQTSFQFITLSACLESYYFLEICDTLLYPVRLGI